MLITVQLRVILMVFEACNVVLEKSLKLVFIMEFLLVILE